ncbi:tetratricopeptide repeat domain-containing protein [Pochonia chlamydosporia 170]|uniref:Tetratricopeptide repeat domain-containing protein n=1 Tax=Pochonia chlamydosporia 170 TaxID=1380566 RepID=A0A179F4H9_METCM|nr:tetratricopeptide repeat domain-containing protein [Pochonia chlamydosporia 170]OAQ60315.1 tetratricopeptide repeat domain-containing protein [Pochonia chlamydosporia 170]
MESNAGFVRLPSKEHGDDRHPQDRVNLWRTAFQDLTQDAAMLMNCICVLSSKPIPQYLFKPINATIPLGFDLFEDAGRHLIEIQQYVEAERTVLDRLDTVEDGSAFAARVHRNMVGLYERTGRSIRAKASASLEFEIVTRQSQSVDNNLANSWHNVGYTMVSAFEAADAVPYLDKAISMAEDVDESRCWQQFNIDRFLRNRARAHQQLLRFEEAVRDFEKAEYYQQKIHGSDSHYDGETHYERAKIEAWRGNLAEAYSLATKAHDLVSADKPTQASVMAAQYRLGWIAMLQEKNDLALQHLEKSLAISKGNEKDRAKSGKSGESARTQWRMSQVLERMGKEEEARSLRETAVKVKDSLLATADYAQVEDEESSWDALVGLLFR